MTFSRQIMIKCNNYDDRRSIASMLADAGIEVFIDKITKNFEDNYWIVIQKSDRVKVVE